MARSPLQIVVDNKLVLGSAFTKAASEFRAKSPGKSAVVFGGTGEVGREVIKHLVASDAFDKVTVLTRRPIEYSGENAEKLVQKPADYENMEELQSNVAGHTHAFCCLGTTRGKSGADGFRKVDHDYILNSAKACSENNVEHYSICSSAGANKNSFLLYMKTKGEVNDKIQNMGFPRTSVFLPGMLMCEREESRLLERVSAYIVRFAGIFTPKTLHVPTSVVGWSMVNNAFASVKTPENEVISNADMVDAFEKGQKKN
ncbi:Oxidoreductase htatip2 [Coemansia spiralis]|uniref:Oxidoreductase htatip2 n=2 Tax=Coemansia TaxID=4863 RepID=A0A9W8G6G8_9FUNG|nr:hypothetical protein BX070DRAFT_229637 [Coemansia spiralis]KAJ1990171.1 Oxidoreductase htatip2 [Coemansia umbellata]KAJ2620696.1 Oxidoreductase htatip2 [Coemansia sp. RSA 1358]KAJ2673959.1 Oxidoreductase htatip2 [Coemansia spiralis]